MTLLKIPTCSLVANSGVTLIPVEPLGCAKGPGVVPGNQPLYGSPPPGGSSGGSSHPPSPGNRPPALVLEPVLGSAYGRGPAGGIHVLALDAPH